MDPSIEKDTVVNSSEQSSPRQRCESESLMSTSASPSGGSSTMKLATTPSSCPYIPQRQQTDADVTVVVERHHKQRLKKRNSLVSSVHNMLSSIKDKVKIDLGKAFTPKLTGAAGSEFNPALCIFINDEEASRDDILDAEVTALLEIRAQCTASMQVARRSIWNGSSIVTDNQLKNMYLLLFSAMRTRVRNNFLELFPDGFKGWHMENLSEYVLGLVLIDMAIVDSDMTSFAFSIGNATRVSVVNCPQRSQYTFFMFMGFKSVLHMVIGYWSSDLNRFKACVREHFAEGKPPSPEFIRLIHALRNAVQPIRSSPFFAPHTEQFFKETHDTARQFAAIESALVPHGITWQKGEKIGEGAFASVFKAIDLNTGEVMALKEIPLSIISSSDRKTVISEVEMMKNLRHDRIVSYYGCEEREGKMCILMEFVPNGSLNDMIHEFGALPEALVSRYARQVLEGLNYLHCQHIIHRDIKSANILVRDKGVAKLSDFGTAKAVDANEDNSSLTISGSPLWMAPELIKGCASTEPSDVWSFGCTVIEMVTGSLPWKDKHFTTVESVFYCIVTATEPPLWPDTVSPDLNDFLKKCLAIDPVQRASCKELLSHPFITDPPAKTPIRKQDSDASSSFATGPTPSMHSIGSVTQPQWGDTDSGGGSPPQQSGALPAEARESTPPQGSHVDI